MKEESPDADAPELRSREAFRLELAAFPTRQGQQSSCPSDKTRGLERVVQLPRDMTLRHWITSFQLVEHALMMVVVGDSVSPSPANFEVISANNYLDLNANSHHIAAGRRLGPVPLAA